uniref:PIPK domain-containing protein n=1 Tax=Eutreptiella gymnastica TaxID=73025 RepID=A0A6U8KJS9_9EUGL|mmetsp:Transcript_7149/g.12639  ORF Transcript_7149/g.12639 Transcript_7149/m.12639 type:complete len:884 (+) Transcript_7149:99-2750(+)
MYALYNNEEIPAIAAPFRPRTSVPQLLLASFPQDSVHTFPQWREDDPRLEQTVRRVLDSMRSEGREEATDDDWAYLRKSARSERAMHDDDVEISQSMNLLRKLVTHASTCEKAREHDSMQPNMAHPMQTNMPPIMYPYGGPHAHPVPILPIGCVLPTMCGFQGNSPHGGDDRSKVDTLESLIKGIKEERDQALERERRRQEERDEELQRQVQIREKQEQMLMELERERNNLQLELERQKSEKIAEIYAHFLAQVNEVDTPARMLSLSRIPPDDVPSKGTTPSIFDSQQSTCTTSPSSSHFQSTSVAVSACITETGDESLLQLAVAKQAKVNQRYGPSPNEGPNASSLPPPARSSIVASDSEGGNGQGVSMLPVPSKANPGATLAKSRKVKKGKRRRGTGTDPESAAVPPGNPQGVSRPVATEAGAAGAAASPGQHKQPLPAEVTHVPSSINIPGTSLPVSLADDGECTSTVGTANWNPHTTSQASPGQASLLAAATGSAFSDGQTADTPLEASKAVLEKGSGGCPLTQQIVFGLRHAALGGQTDIGRPGGTKQRQNPSCSLAQMDFLQKTSNSYSLQLPQQMSSSAAKHKRNNGSFTCQEVCPRVFANIRQMHGISDEDYALAWDFQCVDRSRESDGRSGSFLIHSVDKRFIFKSIQVAEVAAILGKDSCFLKDYYHHLRKHPTSLLMRILGLFCYTLPQTVWGIVLVNALHHPSRPPVTKIYDLKGRQPKAGKFGKFPDLRVTKDNEITRKFYVPHPTRRDFFGQLQMDMHLLEGHGLMDYSVLVGTIPCLGVPRPQGELGLCGGHSAQGTVWMWGSDPKGNPEIYMVGIIDCLTKYTMKKTAAHFFKTFLWTPAQLSTVKPGYYALRLGTYMEHMVEESEA